MKDEPIRSVSRTFEILEYFRAQQRPLALKHIVNHFNYPVASTADLLKSLLQLGYLSFDVKSKTYVPAPHLFELTAWMSGELIGRPRIVCAMKQLQREHPGRTVLMGSMNDIELMLIVRVEGNDVRSGTAHRPLVKSGMGQVLLSAEDNSVVERIYRLTVARRLIDRSSLSLNQLFQRLDEIRATGYALSDDQIALGYSLVSMLLPADYCYRPLAISIHGRTEDITADTTAIVQALKNFVSQRFNIEDAWGMPAEPTRDMALSTIGMRVH